MIRTLLTTVAALALTLAITGCGGDDETDGTDKAKDGETTGETAKKQRSAPGSGLSAAQDQNGG